MRRFISCALLFVLAAPPALAMEAPGFYAGVTASVGQRSAAQGELGLARAELEGPGALVPPDTVINDNVPPLVFDLLSEGLTNFPGALSGMSIALFGEGQLHFSPGTGGGLLFGYRMGNGLRLEADLSTMSFAAVGATPSSASLLFIEGGLDGSNDWTWSLVDELPGLGGSDTLDFEDITLGARLDTRATFFLLNAFHDFDVGMPFTPYAGLGAGFAHLSTDYVAPDCSCSESYVVNASAIVPAAQLGTGLRMPLADRVTLDLGYRFKLAGSARLTAMEIHDDVPLIGDGAFSALGVSQSGIITVHTVQAGLTFALP